MLRDQISINPRRLKGERFNSLNIQISEIRVIRGLKKQFICQVFPLKLVLLEAYEQCKKVCFNSGIKKSQKLLRSSRKLA